MQSQLLWWQHMSWCRICKNHSQFALDGLSKHGEYIYMLWMGRCFPNTRYANYMNCSDSSSSDKKVLWVIKQFRVQHCIPKMVLHCIFQALYFLTDWPFLNFQMNAEFMAKRKVLWYLSIRQSFFSRHTHQSLVALWYQDDRKSGWQWHIPTPRLKFGCKMSLVNRTLQQRNGPRSTLTSNISISKIPSLYGQVDGREDPRRARRSSTCREACISASAPKFESTNTWMRRGAMYMRIIRYLICFQLNSLDAYAFP